MALYEFLCSRCNHRFEQITKLDAKDAGECPKCGKSDLSERLISKFAVSGQGDQRESTQHGCHGHSGVDSGHKHGSGCGH